MIVEYDQLCITDEEVMKFMNHLSGKGFEWYGAPAVFYGAYYTDDDGIAMEHDDSMGGEPLVRTPCPHCGCICDRTFNMTHYRDRRMWMLYSCLNCGATWFISEKLTGNSFWSLARDRLETIVYVLSRFFRKGDN